MCTSASYKTKSFYFGRTLDHGFSYGERVTITPRRFPLHFRHSEDMYSHYAIMGMAHISEGYPLYYDAMNEKGVCIAGLNFPGNAHYNRPVEGKENVASFELVPYILAKCENITQVRELLNNINITDTPFSEKLPPSPLHWMIADRNECIVVESVKEGLKIYDNPVGVMTNNPTFDMQMMNLNNYMHLSPKPAVNRFAYPLHYDQYSLGMGAIGLPGDLSSMSRFVRAAFVRMNSVSGDTETESVNQFFHILNSVEQQKGCCILENHAFEITVYTSCMNADRGIYYYTTYNNHQISAVNMYSEDLDGRETISYALVECEQIHYVN